MKVAVSMRLYATLAMLGVAAGLLSACNRNPFIVEITDCPGVAFVKGANTLTRIAPGRPGNAEDVQFTAAMTGLKVTCDDKVTGVRTDIRFDIEAKQLMAGLPNLLEVPYFVAVVKGGDEMVSKQVYTARIPLNADSQRGGVQERFTQSIPTNEMADKDHFEVLIGFQLSETEAAYNVRNFGAD